jgi:hypothetical protein
MRTNERVVRWTSWTGDTTEELRIGEESGGWTADGTISGLDVQYALRLDAAFGVRQFLLFRDLDEPDLWLARDRYDRWGEVNGAHRPDLEGCTDVALDASPFWHGVAIRRLGLDVDGGADVTVAVVDIETLGVRVETHHYHRTGPRSWRHRSPGGDGELTVDDDGLVLDHAGRFRRVQ